ncbi:DgyrCDS3617 [Dimorphilus gyrociliatus]|uniref:DgyrCDS3617 n=1 Tax=Dimorphilus gyrociliatus TaxID=2664684 RepID=A0A7I8VFT3_9ANNE|nr:DgyrCDS3617 [Dimorphilus gyrociliatus]
MSKLVILYCFVVLKLINAFPNPTETYSYGTVLRDPDIYRVFWKEDGHSITFELHVKNKGGWVGFGISPNGGMKGSDIFTAKLVNGQLTFEDRHAVAKSKPIKDKLQDWEVIVAKEVGDHVIYKIKRKLQTCDPEEDREIKPGTVRLIWAYGSITSGTDYLTQHSDSTKRGTRSVQLIAGEIPEKKLPDGLKTIDIKVNNFTLPKNRDTFYRCEIVKLPKLPGKRHIVAFEPIFDTKHPEILHHIFLFGCNNYLNINDSHTGSDYECYTDQTNMGTSRDRCNIVMLAWGVGGQRYVVPDEVGFPIGRDEDPSYIRFEMHYDNPGLKENIVDNSGFRLFYTDKLRKYDTSVLEVGHKVTRFQIVPPNVQDFVTFGKCPSECLEEVFDKAGLEEVTVFASILHAHIKGVKIKLKIFRGDKELEPLMEESTYDFNYQDIINLPKLRKIRKGDRLTVECTYDTLGENQAVLGGQSTRQEMCLAFISYYPALPISKCVSEPIRAKTAPIYQSIKGGTIDWTRNNQIEIQREIANSEEVQVYCDNGQIRYKVDDTKITVSNNYVPYTKPNLCDGFPMPSEKYPFSEILKEPNVYKVYWKVVKEMITFEIQVKTKGWVGFGISPNGNMKGSDVIMAWMANGKFHLQDRHAVAKSEPVLDKKQDWKLIWGKTYHEFSIYKFERKLKTCDEEDIDIGTGTTRLIWSYSTALMGEGDNFVGHATTNRGTKSVLLLNTKSEKSDEMKLADSEPIDFRIGNFSLPSDVSTYYRCEMFKLPDLTKKHHIIAAEPIIDTRHPSLLHHIFIYGCGHDHEIKDEHVGQGYRCGSDEINMAGQFDQCNIVFFAWAVGGSRFFFPDDVGLPIGSSGDSKYFRMEVHYDNPSFQENVTDTSGIRFWITDKVRKNDLRIMEVGHDVTPKQIIPPRSSNFLTVGSCPEQCLSKAFEASGREEVTIFLALLHAHLKGVRMKLRHFRDGVELEPINYEKSYDFNFQEYSLLPKFRTLKKNDRLVAECTYDSSNDDKPTFGGLATENEMCLAYVAHYPPIQLSRCHTQPANLKYSIRQKDSIDWLDEKVKADLQKSAKSRDVDITCSNGKVYYLSKDQSRNVTLEPYKKEYKAPNLCDKKEPGPNDSSRAFVNSFLFSILCIFYTVKLSMNY